MEVGWTDCHFQATRMGQPIRNREIRPFLSQTQCHHLHFSGFCCPEDGREAVAVQRVNRCAMFQQHFGGANLSSRASRSWRTSKVHKMIDYGKHEQRSPKLNAKKCSIIQPKHMQKPSNDVFFWVYRTYLFLQLSHMASPHCIKCSVSHIDTSRQTPIFYGIKYRRLP